MALKRPEPGGNPASKANARLFTVWLIPVDRPAMVSESIVERSTCLIQRGKGK